ncbi:HigA family addiction module antitoxin [Thermithiobacillus plumbiphilus]|uniref:HigA family addiction module antitoxin n=1 Tax=Thermithiobacillus plumbiphilus TaxID=1729899 RepID=A0ABU9D6N3_9PROT
MIKTFADRRTQELYATGEAKRFSADVAKRATPKLEYVDLATRLDDLDELLRERRGMSPEMAIRLGRLFGNTPEFWLNGQMAVDLWDAAEAIKDDVARIKPLNAA